jgi:hypothetical protein
MPDRSEGRSHKCWPWSSRLEVWRGDPYSVVLPVRKEEVVATPQQEQSSSVSPLMHLCAILYYIRRAGVAQAHSDCLLHGRPRGRSSSHGRGKNFLHIVQTGSGVHPASYPMGTGGSLPGGKAAEARSYLPPISAKVKKTWIYISIPPYTFMA